MTDPVGRALARTLLKYDHRMFAAERRHLIVERVRANGAASLVELAALADSSEATIRRDLRLLAEQGLVSRSRGGAALPSVGVGASLQRHGWSAPSDEDRVIATLAATFVRDGDAVVLGAGPTAQELARQLVDRANLTVVTNSILVCQELVMASAVEVVMTGGSLRGATFALVGSEAEHSLAGLRVGRAFLSGGGLTVTRGLSTANMSDASVDRALAAAAEEVFVMVDHSRLGVDTMFQTVPPERISHVLTDAAVDDDLLGQFAAIGVVPKVADSAQVNGVSAPNSANPV